jgi:hypothetical protein
MEMEMDMEQEMDMEIEGGTGGDPKPAAESRADVYAATFETFRKNYPGTKRGRETEFAVLKKHKDWRDVVYRTY